MTQFIYTHHQGSEGKLLEKARMLEPDPSDYDMGIYYSNAMVGYRNHANSLLSYPTLGFSPSDNGMTFNEDQFEVKEEEQFWEGAYWCPSFHLQGGKAIEGVNVKRGTKIRVNQIAVPLSEKREERTQDELWEEIEKTGCIYLSITGHGMPPVSLFTENPFIAQPPTHD